MDMMKSLAYLRRQEGILESLLEMLDYATLRLSRGKDVPPYMLKELIELLQMYLDISHKTTSEMMATLLGYQSTDSTDCESDRRRAALRKYELFLLKVVEAYDLGYDGAKWVFARYAGRYISSLRQRLEGEKEILPTWIEDREQRDREILKKLKKINGEERRRRERAMARIESLKQELEKVAA
jgi:hemerythrin-like domain-containing protein